MGRALLDAWRRHWFAPASLTDLGAARIVVAVIFLVLDPRLRYLRAALVPAPFWHPESLVALPVLPQPDVATVVWLGRLTTWLLVLVVLGVWTRPALALLLPLVVVQESWLNAAGKITHGTIPLVWALLFLTLAPCDRALALGAVRRRAREAAAGTPAALRRRPRRARGARWPIELVFVELAGFYAAAGYTKLRTSGLAWADGWTLQFFLLDLGTPSGVRVAQSVGLCAVLSALVLAFEVGAPLGVVRRLRPAVLAGGAAFHLGTTLLMRIAFWPVVALYAVFVPWSRAAARLGRRLGLRAGTVTLRRDRHCPRCRAVASVAGAFDPGRRLSLRDPVHATHGGSAREGAATLAGLGRLTPRTPPLALALVALACVPGIAPRRHAPDCRLQSPEPESRSGSGPRA